LSGIRLAAGPSNERNLQIPVTCDQDYSCLFSTARIAVDGGPGKELHYIFSQFRFQLFSFQTHDDHKIRFEYANKQ